VRRTEHREELAEVVLDGRAREDDAAHARERLQRLRRLGLLGLEAVPCRENALCESTAREAQEDKVGRRTLVADDEADRRLSVLDVVDERADLRRLERQQRVDERVHESLEWTHLVVADNEDVVALVPREGADRVLGVGDVDAQLVAPEPFADLGAPVLRA